MAEVTLTLNDLKFANVSNFSRNFGQKKLSTVNGGSLTTEEFNIANALPFDKQRPYVVTENSTFSEIEYDAKLLVNAASITVTLGTAITGITVTIATLYDTTIKYGTVTQTLKAGETCKLMYFNDTWKDQLNSSLAELQTERSYSTEEHFTGKYWIDGKKMYEKTFILSSIGSEFTEFDSGISNLSDLITWEGNLQTATQIYSINRYQADFYYNKATHKFTYQSQTTLSFTRGNISITYTKTTD